MSKFVKFSEIKQFRNVVQDLKHQVQFIEYNEEQQKPIYDWTIKMPKIKVIGSEKIHGTNLGIGFNMQFGFWVQSKKDTINQNKDNAAAAFHAEQNKEIWIDIIQLLANEYNINLHQYKIVVFAEWCGDGIQDKTAVQGLDKRAIIFQHFCAVDKENSEDKRWFETKINNKWIDNKTYNIFNIMNFPIYQMEIDFENPQLYQNKMIEIVEKIEENSPVGQQFGIQNNIAEGVVWTFMYDGNLYRWKVKGEKHSKSKIKKLQKVDNKKIQKIIDIANQVTPAWRLEQFFTEVNDILNNGIPNIKNLGEFIKEINKDIIKEESDVIAEAKLEPKDVFKYTGKICADWYKDYLDKTLMN